MNDIKIAVQNQFAGLFTPKKIGLIISIIIFACNGIMAQSTTPAQVSIGSTYVSPFRADVYPYQTGLKPNVDYSVHFKLNKGTKFTVVAVKDSSGTIQGYAITPWRFEDRDSNMTKTKSKFYKAITDLARRKIIASTKIRDSIKKKQDSLKVVKTQLEKD